MNASNTKWNDKPRLALETTIAEVEFALSRLIPIPNAITHNVALALDEVLREALNAWAEMPEDGKVV